jgi:hypothetical protein
MTWISALGGVSIWIILLPLLLGILLYKQLNKESKFILWVVFLGSIPQVLRSFVNNTPLLDTAYNLYTPAEFVLYFLMFNYKSKWALNQKMLKITFVLYIGFSIIFLQKIGISERFISEWAVTNNAFQILWVCLCLLEYYKYEDSIIGTNQPFFWFISGITLYATCTIVFFCLWHFIKKEDEYKELYELIHHVFNILLYVCFTIGIIKNKRILFDKKNQ